MAGEEAAGGGYGNYAGAASAIGGLITQLMQGAPDNSAYKDQRDQMRKQQMYQAASVDPTHPWNVNLTNQIKQQLQQEAAHSIIANLIAKQRLRSRGYAHAVGNPARQDEAQSGALAKAFMQAGQIAQQTASQRLAQAGGSPAGLTANMGEYANQAYGMSAAKNQTTQNQVMSSPFMAAGIGQLLQQLFSGSGTSGQAQQPVETAFSNSPWMIGQNQAYSGSTV